MSRIEFKRRGTSSELIASKVRVLSRGTSYAHILFENSLSLHYRFSDLSVKCSSRDAEPRIANDWHWSLPKPSHIMTDSPSMPKRIGIAADHGGFSLKEHLVRQLRATGYSVTDFGDHELASDDDYPDFVMPLAHAVVEKAVDRGIAVCGSGVGANVVANKVRGVRACLIHESFSARQGVEDDDLNMICLGGLVVSNGLAWELVKTFLAARFSGEARHCRRLARIADLETAR